MDSDERVVGYMIIRGVCFLYDDIEQFHEDVQGYHWERAGYIRDSERIIASVNLEVSSP